MTALRCFGFRFACPVLLFLFLLLAGQDRAPAAATFPANGNSSDLVIAQETSPPVITSVTPSGSIYEVSTAIGVTYSDSESDIDPAGVTVTLDGTALSCYSKTPTAAYCYVSNLTLGAHMIGGSVQDRVGNAAEISGSFTVVDNTQPDIWDLSPQTYKAIHFSSITISAKYNDPVWGYENCDRWGCTTYPIPSSGIDSDTATVKIDGNPLSGCTAADTGVTCTASGLGNGNHSITVSVADRSGNINTESGAFIVSHGLLNISDNATGGDCTTVGEWDAATKTCRLTQDVTGDGYGGIDILSNNVTLDGQGHLVSNTVSSSTEKIGIFLSERTGVTVKRVQVSGFTIGIMAKGGSSNFFLENEISNSTEWGLRIENSNGNQVQGNEVRHNVAGIGIMKGNQNNIRDNFSHDNGTGIYISSVGEIYAEPGSQGNTIEANQVSQNSMGIRVAYCHYNRILENTVNNNGASGYGISIESSSYTEVNDNTITGSSIGVWAGGSNGSYSRNDIHNYTAVKLSGNNNVFFRNIFRSLGNPIQLSSSSGNNFNMPLPVGGNTWHKYDTRDEGCNDSDLNGFCDSAFSFPGGSDNYPVAPSGPDETAPRITYVSPNGVAYFSSPIRVRVRYEDSVAPATGVDPSSVIVNLDGRPLAGCVKTPQETYCDVSGLEAGRSYQLTGSLADGGGNTATFQGSFTFVNPRPDLSLNSPTAYWASYSDYETRLLSTNWSIHNSSNFEATNVKVTLLNNTNNVTTQTALPLSIGSIGAGANAPLTLVFSVPSGVASWRSHIYASAKSSPEGGTWLYP